MLTRRSVLDKQTHESFWKSFSGQTPIVPEHVVPEHAIISVSKYIELLIDFRKWELSRIRKQLKSGKRKTFTSRFLDDIDKRILEIASKLCEKPNES